MGNLNLLQLIVPILPLVFAAGFWTIHCHDRKGLPSARWYSVGFLCAFFGFTVDLFRDQLPLLLVSYVSNAFLVGGATCFVVATFMRYGTVVPKRTIAAILAASFCYHSYFLVFSPNMELRIVGLGFAVGLLFTLPLAAMVKVPLLKVDKLIFATLVLTALQLIFRPVVMIYYFGFSVTPENYSSSLLVISLLALVAFAIVVGAVALLFAYAQDLIDSLSKISETDHLSGLLNRRGFQKRFEKHAFSPESKTSCLILCDIDEFKTINDTHGHVVGDKVIAAFGSLISGFAEGSCHAGRIGGEEFAILLTALPLPVGRLYAEGLRATFEAACPENRRVTASFGVTEFRLDQKFEDVMRDADRALYEAKRTGRNRVCCAPPDVANPTTVSENPAAQLRLVMN